MATRAGGSPLLWSRDRAGRRLGVIELEIRRILEEFPTLQPRRRARVHPTRVRYARTRQAAVKHETRPRFH